MISESLVLYIKYEQHTVLCELYAPKSKYSASSASSAFSHVVEGFIPNPLLDDSLQRRCGFWEFRVQVRRDSLHCYHLPRGA